MKRAIVVVLLALLGGSACNLFAGASPPTPIPPTATAEPPTASPEPAQTPLPTTIPPPVCTPIAGWQTYTVSGGDTLYSIARRSGSTVAALAAANCLADPGALAIGQVLYVPRPLATVTATTAPGYVAVYLVLPEDGGASGLPIGCGDSLVSQQTAFPISGDPAADLRTALEAMFAIRGGPPFNAFESSPLTVQSVSVTGSHAAIQLGGPLLLSGTCADARMEAQLVLNVFRSPQINTARIEVDGRNLKVVFDLSGQIVLDEPYTRADANRLIGRPTPPCMATAPTTLAVLDTGMGASARMIGEIPADTPFQVLGYFSHTGMLHVQSGGQLGWVDRAGVVFGPDCAALPDYSAAGQP